jgi:hypothetical protein
MDKTEPQSKPADAQWAAWLTKQQAAARLRKSVAVVRKLADRGYLHPVLRNGIRLFPLAEVEAFARPGRRPLPWLPSPSKSRSAKATPARSTEGEEAARVFRLIDQGVGLREIVMRTRVPPHRVRTLYREWQRTLEEGPPRDGHTLGDGAELDQLAAAAEDLFARED